MPDLLSAGFSHRCHQPERKAARPHPTNEKLQPEEVKQLVYNMHKSVGARPGRPDRITPGFSLLFSDTTVEVGRMAEVPRHHHGACVSVLPKSLPFGLLHSNSESWGVLGSRNPEAGV